MQRPFSGHAFGLRFVCQRFLPELSGDGPACTPEPAVVTIDWPCATVARHAASAPQAVLSADGDTFDLRLPGIATYRVTATTIDVAPDPETDDRTVRAFLFGSAVGALLHLRRQSVLHASAVQMQDGSAVAFVGLSTAGKSTLAAALGQRGYPLLADDIVALRHDGAKGGACCLPGLSRTKLWRHALDTLDLSDQATGCRQVRPDLDKYSLPTAVSTDAAPLHRVVELVARERGELAARPVSGLEKISLLLRNTFRPAILAAVGGETAHLQRMVALAPTLTAMEITRPRDRTTLQAICDLLESEWKP